jgi:hypothetical protein
VSDLAPLAGLSALRELYLQETPARDLAPLAGLENLKTVMVESQARRSQLVRTLGRTRGEILRSSE